MLCRTRIHDWAEIETAPPGMFVEIFPAGPHDVAALGYALSQTQGHDGALLWVQDRMSSLELGRPFGRGIRRGFAITGPILHVGVRTAQDALWAMEEALRCTAVAAVVGELWGLPKALNFTASKRLAMRSERSGTPLYLIRHGAARELSAARDRWCIRSLPSAPHPHDDKAPGAPRWALERFRSRAHQTGEWEGRYDRKTHDLALSARFGVGLLGAAPAPLQPQAQSG